MLKSCNCIQFCVCVHSKVKTVGTKKEDLMPTVWIQGDEFLMMSKLRKEKVPSPSETSPWTGTGSEESEI
ncbi:hypothetical protein AB3S75_039853 [Citrus x aurantiifolia]